MAPSLSATEAFSAAERAWLAADAAELTAVVTYPRGESPRIIVEAHDEDGETIRRADCPLSADVAPDVNLRGDAQRDAERSAIEWVLGWAPEHEGSGCGGEHVISFW